MRYVLCWVVVLLRFCVSKASFCASKADSSRALSSVEEFIEVLTWDAMTPRDCWRPWIMSTIFFLYRDCDFLCGY